jgi:hypothetical protein
MQEPHPSLEERTQAVFALRQEWTLDGEMTKGQRRPLAYSG